MDRLAQTALSALRQMQDNKFDLANNLANVNVPGFRRDLPNEGNAGFLKELEKLSAKVLPLETEVRKFSNEAGSLQNTGLETDVAVLNEGFFYIQPENGEIALSRRGDLGLNAQNQLVNGVGDLVLSDGLEPIILPKKTIFQLCSLLEDYDGDVKISNLKSKIKFKQGKLSKKSGYKKAIVTLKKGQSIDLTTGI